MKKVLENLSKGLEDSGIKARSIKSQKWYEDKLKETKEPINRRELKNELNQMNPIRTPMVGRMYTFFYEAKGKMTLPYYDKFPLIFMMGIESANFHGINLHYLPLDLRQELFYNLLDRVNKQSYDKQTFLKIDYDFLNGFRKYKAFRPCFKQYSLRQVRGKIVNIPSSEWESAIYLPTAWWRKASEQVVHADSRRQYRSTK